MTIYVTSHPSLKKEAEGYAAGMPHDEDEEVEVVTDSVCPPGRIYVTGYKPVHYTR